MLRYCAIFALTLAARVAPAADWALPDYLPPDTRVVVGIQLRGIFNSPLVQGYLAEAKGSSSAWLAQTPFAGFDPLKDLDEVLIASTGSGQNPPTLIVLRGRFDKPSLSRGAQQYHGIPLLAGKMADKGVALFDGETLVAGTPAMVHAAIDRRGHGKTIDPALTARIQPLRGKYLIWAAGDRPDGFAAAGGGPAGLEGMDSFAFGAALEHGLDLTATVHLRSAADAEKMATSMQLLETLAKTQPSSSEAKIQTHVQNNTITLSVALPEAALRKAIDQQKDALALAIAQAQPTRNNVGLSVRPAAPLLLMQPTSPPPPPASRETKIVSDPAGNSVLVTLPGRR